MRGTAVVFQHGLLQGATDVAGGDCDDGVKQAIAKKLIALAKTGERNPDILCEEVLKDIRRPQQWTASGRLTAD